MAHAPTEEKHDDGLEVVSVSEHNPKVRTVRVGRPELEEASFLPAVLKGLGITIRHFFQNVGGKGRRNHQIETIQYPEEPIEYPERTRGLHRLTLRDDGSVRCVACMCCPTVCPANCITIIPEETHATDVDGHVVIEKRPAVFEIDELRCVVCGLCVEACPCDAIRMDTQMHAKPTYSRADAIETKKSMMDRNDLLKSARVIGGNKISGTQDDHSTAVQGGVGATWRDPE
ncbi:MAG: NADH-quinone oxidoreductase subunit I [Deltaproteobacteria bacterium]|jgi:NADH-quinone oxidoreductase subunit I|nr:NADH-quinone oxidoreductase subunit I [Deltaproteobacteria bacterium]